MAQKSAPAISPAVSALARCLDAYTGRYRELTGASSFGDYASGSAPAADEEQLTEPLLASIRHAVKRAGDSGPSD